MGCLDDIVIVVNESVLLSWLVHNKVMLLSQCTGMTGAVIFKMSQ